MLLCKVHTYASGAHSISKKPDGHESVLVLVDLGVYYLNPHVRPHIQILRWTCWISCVGMTE
jgi:hypothetical protein